MCCNDRRQILFVLQFTGYDLTDGGCGGICKMRRRRGALNSRVHIGFVVIADINHVMPSFHGAGERLEADVVGATVSAEGNEFIGVINLAPLL